MALLKLNKFVLFLVLTLFLALATSAAEMPNLRGAALVQVKPSASVAAEGAAVKTPGEKKEAAVPEKAAEPEKVTEKKTQTEVVVSAAVENVAEESNKQVSNDYCERCWDECNTFFHDRFCERCTDRCGLDRRLKSQPSA